MAATLKNNAFALASAIEATAHCRPGTALVIDGHHRGTLFTWLGKEWAVTCLEQRKFMGTHARIAVVALTDADADADDGLNQAALGIDLECGEWVVPTEELPALCEGYGDALEVLWEQE